ncbi:MAG: carboxypeptidase regulatory-like domain-containing protein [Deltaproteobacteria bacterium]|nr:carboxypeptidase regulatory-like domain-containing protein [Deltaproteobacteria bacterium]
MRALAVAIALAVALPATAAPTIDIRAQTTVALDRIRLRGDGIAEVTGQLVDKLTGDGLGAQNISIKIGDDFVTATTGPDGRFRAQLTVPPGPQSVELKFPGGNLLEPSQQTIVTDPSKAQVVLTVAVEDAIGGANIIVSATADDVAAGLPVELAVGNRVEIELGATPNGDLKPVQTITTGQPFLLARKAAGGAGPKRLRVVFAGDETRQRAQVEASFELTTATHTTMEVSTLQLPFEDDLIVTGKVIDEEERAVQRAAVTLVSGDRRLAQGATADDGSYKFKVEGEIIGQGQYAVQVQSDPGLSFIKPSRSPPAIIKVSTPQPVPVSYTIAAFIATVFAAGGFFTARAKPWRRFRRAAPAAEVPSNESEVDVALGGLVANKPSVMSTLRRPNDDGFSGVVRDTIRSRPVPEAVVSLTLGDTEREVRTDEDGSFVLEKLVPGEWRAAVAAPGHVTEKFGVSIPHRGELRGVRIDLVPVRERVFQLYRRAAEPLLPEPRLWGVWSPRQIVDHVRSKRPSPAFADLTDFVEEVYFSPRLAPETLLATANERVEQAIRERTRGAP